MRIVFVLILLGNYLLLIAQQVPLSSPAAGLSTVYDHGKAGVRADPVLPNPAWAPFYHGVASGDALTDQVILWTRVTPPRTDTTLEVGWKIALDPQLQQVVLQGKVLTDGQRDFTVKVDAGPLSPGTTYYYGFSALGKNSLTGRTRTAPALEDPLRFGVVSCSAFQTGYFNAYKALARRHDLQAIIHLGDYIYEYPNAAYAQTNLVFDRPIEPDGELLTLNDYRMRYASYRLDSNLIRAHQQHGFYLIWDDHEIANNGWKDGADNHQSNEGPWASRKAAAKQAWTEWLPVRTNPSTPVYRSVDMGPMLQLTLLDTRFEGRGKLLTSVLDSMTIRDSTRSILGKAQRDWLESTLTGPQRWNLIGNQVLMAPFHIGWAALGVSGVTHEQVENNFLDNWEGYPLDRESLMQWMKAHVPGKNLVVTGDFHITLANDLSPNPLDYSFRQHPLLGRIPIYTLTGNYDPVDGRGTVATEWVTPSVTSFNFDEINGPNQASILENQLNKPLPLPEMGNPNPHIRQANVSDHGFTIVTIEKDTAHADVFYVPILEETETVNWGLGTWTLNGAGMHLQKANFSKARGNLAIPAPLDPPNITTGMQELPALLLLAPNPCDQFIDLQWAQYQEGTTRFLLLDHFGRQVQNQEMLLAKGLYHTRFSTGHLPPGKYFLVMEQGQRRQIYPLIRQ